eukprot:NODE_14278_length_241_cov_3.395833_g13365_i0.p3 GENE.NODE_14278_length_241_cov_3.395833_g13365_i0~~NODE_14278_length_241_cov_3.395833_g13365_i0.p3  ORF type:complete len:53 (+),score=12.97 NODE_14278_length_241_cov_3.395833_g13365_i0:32-160(+)
MGEPGAKRPRPGHDRELRCHTCNTLFVRQFDYDAHQPCRKPR